MSRLYCRAYIVKMVKSDDWIMLAALVSILILGSGVWKGDN